MVARMVPIKATGLNIMQLVLGVDPGKQDNGVVGGGR